MLEDSKFPGFFFSSLHIFYIQPFNKMFLGFSASIISVDVLDLHLEVSVHGNIQKSLGFFFFYMSEDLKFHYREHPQRHNQKSLVANTSRLLRDTFSLVFGI